MPEGPEIRRAADRVAHAVVDQPLQAVTFAFERLAEYQEVLSASRVLAVDTHGKAMLTRFSCGLTVYSHNQLYGRWMVGAADREPATRRSLRFAIVAQRRAARLYSASEIAVLPDEDVELDPRIARLGPDALHESTTAKLVAARLRSREFSGRQLGALLLDQGFVAGLGNYLRSDILHRSKVHPRRHPRDLAPAKIRALARNIVELPRRSYETGGITNEPRRVEAMRKAGVSRRELRHLAFHRAGRPCYACGDVIERIELSRAVFVCPSCQPEVTA